MAGQKIRIVESPKFKKASKKLKSNQLKDLQQAVKDIGDDIFSGRLKTGDLRGVRVHKFKMVGQLTLIAYTFEENTITLSLLAFGSHENFYRDLKR